MEKGEEKRKAIIKIFKLIFRLVEFSDREGMEYALKELDDTKLDGNRIRLTEEGGGKNSSRSRSRSDRRGNRRSVSRRSRSKSMDRRSPEKARRHRSPTPDEKSRSRSNDHSRTDDINKNMDRKSEEKRQRSRTPDEKSRSRSDDQAR
jgi:RNA recognition motif-containing protein